MTKDVLKFFQAFIWEMVDIGGENLPRSISSNLGSRLARLYKERNSNANLEQHLKLIYAGLNAKLTLKSSKNKIYEIIIKYPNKFCPIGGCYYPGRADLVRNNICLPYTKGFLKALSPDFQFKIEIKNCIVSDNSKVCRYILSEQGDAKTSKII